MPLDLPLPERTPLAMPPNYAEPRPLQASEKVVFIADPLAMAVLLSWYEEEDE